MFNQIRFQIQNRRINKRKKSDTCNKTKITQKHRMLNAQYTIKHRYITELKCATTIRYEDSITHCEHPADCTASIR